MSDVPTIHINLDKPCAECGKGGAAGSGLCMSCAADAIDPKKSMKSCVGRVCQENWRRIRSLNAAQREEFVEKLERKEKAKMSRAKKGHNVSGIVSSGELKSFVERIENIHVRKAEASDDEKLVYAEAKARGFDVKVLRGVVARRKKDQQKLAEYEEMLEIYLDAIGDLADTPLGKASEPRVSA